MIPNPTTAACVLSGLDTPDTCDDGVTPAANCLDLEYAANNLAECPNGSAISRLVIIPDRGLCEVGGHFTCKAFLQFSNGTDKEVTDTSVWVAGNSGVISVATGVITGLVAGQSTVTATYSGMSGYPLTTPLVAFAQITVVAAIDTCNGDGIDFSILIDEGSRSQSLATSIGAHTGWTVLQWLKYYAQVFLDSLKYDIDQAAIIGCRGCYHRTSIPSGHDTIYSTLSSNYSGLVSALNSVTVDYAHCTDANDPDYPDNAIPGSKRWCCAHAIGKGLTDSYDELNSIRHRTGNKKVVVIFASGADQVCSPDPRVLAEQMRLEGFIVIVFLLYPWNPGTSTVFGDGGAQGQCTYTLTTTIGEFFSDIATCQLYYSTPYDTVNPPYYVEGYNYDILGLLQIIRRMICGQIEDGAACFYYPT